MVEALQSPNPAHLVLVDVRIRIRNQKQARTTLSRKAKRKLLEPGYWGSLQDEELEIIQKALENNPNLSFA